MKRLISLLMILILSVSSILISFAVAEEDSEWMKQLVLQLLGIDEETASSMTAEELQNLINQAMNGDAENDMHITETETISFNESIFTDAGFQVASDIFSGQKVIYHPNSNIRFLTYSTKTTYLGMPVDTKIFGKKIKEEDELPVWTDGDTSQFHQNQKNVKFYPCIVYNEKHSVPYSFVVSLSFPKSGKNSWIGMQNPWSIMIATSSNVYTINRYLPSTTSWYACSVFMTVDEEMMKMFLDINASSSIMIRVTSHSSEKEDFIVDSDCIEGIIEAWDMYKQAGGLMQDLSTYSCAVDIRKR